MGIKSVTFGSEVPLERKTGKRKISQESTFIWGISLIVSLNFREISQITLAVNKTE